MISLTCLVASGMGLGLAPRAGAPGFTADRGVLSPGWRPNALAAAGPPGSHAPEGGMNMRPRARPRRSLL